MPIRLFTDRLSPFACNEEASCELIAILRSRKSENPLFAYLELSSLKPQAGNSMKSFSGMSFPLAAFGHR